MAIDEDHDDGLGGRSRRRREVTASRRFGAALVDLPDAALAEIVLLPELAEAVALGRRTTSYAARKRQIATIDAILRDLDDDAIAPIEQALADPERPLRERAARVARWLDRLATGGDGAVDALLAERPDLDRQRVRTLARNLGRERTSARAGRVGRAEAALRALIAR